MDEWRHLTPRRTPPGLAEDGIALFVDGRPVSGDVTATIALWDAGHRGEREAGIRSEPGAAQSGPNTGPAANGVVRLVSDGFVYSPVVHALRITLTPQP